MLFNFTVFRLFFLFFHGNVFGTLNNFNFRTSIIVGLKFSALQSFQTFREF